MTIKILIGRSARTGRFVTFDYVLRHPMTTVLETIRIRRPRKRRCSRRK